MLLVDGEPVLSSAAGAASRVGAVGMELVAALAAHPGLRDAAGRLKATPESRISVGQEGAPRHVYVFQREFATVDPARVEVRRARRDTVVACFCLLGIAWFDRVEQGNPWLVLVCPRTFWVRKMGDLGRLWREFRVYLMTPDSVMSCAVKVNFVFLGQGKSCLLLSSQRRELVGTDEATTCIGVVIRNNRTGMTFDDAFDLPLFDPRTSVSHLDFPKIVEGGLKQMLELLGDDNAPFDVHLIGGFSDASTKVVRSSGKKHIKQEGYSYPLCCKIVEVLHKFQQQFNLRSFCVLDNNTTTDSLGNALPVIGGFVVQTSSGVVTPAGFDMNSRCPDEVVRRIRVSVSSYDPAWQGRMPDWADIASSLNQLSDSEVLMQCSTSPAAEPPHFVENERRIWKYLINNPDWEETFPKHKPRVFHRTSDGSWSRYS
nr:unnamed protein product [Digitaria exilis]